MQPLGIKLPVGKSIVEIAREPCYFMFYKDGILCYKTLSGFVIRIPTIECGSMQLQCEEPKALVLLRWLRPQYGQAIKELNGQTVAPSPEVKLLTAGNPLDMTPVSPDGFRGHHQMFD